jgi:hypothetical protein
VCIVAVGLPSSLTVRQPVLHWVHLVLHQAGCLAEDTNRGLPETARDLHHAAVACKPTWNTGDFCR